MTQGPCGTLQAPMCEQYRTWRWFGKANGSREQASFVLSTESSEFKELRPLRRFWPEAFHVTAGVHVGQMEGPDSRMAMISAPSVVSANCCAMPCS